MNKKTFIEGYFNRSKLLKDKYKITENGIGLKVAPFTERFRADACDCDYEHCKGWKMTTQLGGQHVN